MCVLYVPGSLDHEACMYVVSNYFCKPELSILPKVMRKEWIPNAPATSLSMTTEDCIMAGLNPDSPPKPTPVGSSWDAQCCVKAIHHGSSRAGPSYWGMSVKQPQEGSKHHSTRPENTFPWETRNSEPRRWGPSFDSPFLFLILLAISSPRLWKGFSLSQTFWFCKNVSQVEGSRDILLKEQKTHSEKLSFLYPLLPHALTPLQDMLPIAALCLLHLNTAHSTSPPCLSGVEGLP